MSKKFDELKITKKEAKKLYKAAQEESGAINLDKKNYDAVNMPKHYTDTKIEVINYIEDKNLGFCLGNAIKYISRAGRKESAAMGQKEKSIQDLQKAIWYINRRIKEMEENLCD